MKNESCEVVDILLALINGKSVEEAFKKPKTKCKKDKKKSKGK